MLAELERVNTFGAPPRSPRVDLPPPFSPRLPSPVKAKVQTVATAPPGFPFAVAPAGQTAPPAQPSRPGGAPPPAALIAPPPPPRRRGRSLGLTLLRRTLAFLVIAGLVVGGFFAYQHFKETAPPHPDAWDPRVASLVSFVERARGLEFEHPIYVHFLGEAEYTAATAAPSVPDADALEATRYRSEFLDALGLAAGYDALTGDATMASSTTLGFYSPATDAITVRGAELTPAVRVVLAHELTHALQAQHFDMRLGGADDTALRSIAEADAMRVEQAYLATLPPEEQAMADALDTLTPEAAASLASIPWTVVEMGYAPYTIGPAYVASVVAREGNGGVDELLEHPPSERMLLTPWRALVDDTDVTVKVPTPELTNMVEKSRPLTMIQLLVMLDAWLPWTMARSSLDTFAGAGYTSYRYGEQGPLCVAAAVQFDGSPQPFADALRWWAGASGSTAVPEVEGNTVSFEACARGAAATTPPTPVITPSRAVVIENSLVPVGAEVGGVRDVAPFLCAARALIDDPLIAPILVAAAPTPDQLVAVDTARNDALRACGQ